MNHLSCRERRFPFRLSEQLSELYGEYLHWYRHLVERLGLEETETVWKRAFSSYPDDPIDRLLTSDWQVDSETGDDSDTRLREHLDRFFSKSIDSVSIDDARRVVESTPPVPQIRSQIPSLSVMRMSTTYEALLLTKEGFALLAEALMDSYGKAGELIVYDILLEEIQNAGFTPLTVREFMAQRKERFGKAPETLDMPSAGLEVDLISCSENEIITRVRECEWARFFRERHPRVGYLLSCSCDDPAYRAINPHLRLQRTSTLMEGGDRCDFRIYEVP